MSREWKEGAGDKAKIHFNFILINTVCRHICNEKKEKAFSKAIWSSDKQFWWSILVPLKSYSFDFVALGFSGQQDIMKQYVNVYLNNLFT